MLWSIKYNNQLNIGNAVLILHFEQRRIMGEE